MWCGVLRWVGTSLTFLWGVVLSSPPLSSPSLLAHSPKELWPPWLPTPCALCIGGGPRKLLVASCPWDSLHVALSWGAVWLRAPWPLWLPTPCSWQLGGGPRNSLVDAWSRLSSPFFVPLRLTTPSATCRAVARGRTLLLPGMLRGGPRVALATPSAMSLGGGPRCREGLWCGMLLWVGMFLNFLRGASQSSSSSSLPSCAQPFAEQTHRS